MILVLGGTSDSLRICEFLNKLGAHYKVSVTTEYGKSLSLKCTEHVILKALDLNEMTALIRDEKIDKIIDATHPYAVEVSKTATLAAKMQGISYVRYERKSLLKDVYYEKMYLADTLEEAASLADQMGNRIFLGTGSKNLEEYWNRLKHKVLFARILPTSKVISLCEAIGFAADQIVAMKGPFSTRMNEVLFKDYEIDVVITKESGKEGGFLEKIEACRKLDIPVIVLRRSSLIYPYVVHKIEDVLKAPS